MGRATTGGRRTRPCAGPATGATRVVAGLLLVAAALGACGGRDGDRADRASVGATTSTTAGVTSTTTSPATTAAAPTTASPAPPRGGASPPAPAAGGAPAGVSPFTAPGTYRYTTTGRFTSPLTGPQVRDGEATLVVDPPSGRDQRTVRQGPGPRTEQMVRIDGADVLLVSLRIADQGLDKEVRPSPPALALPGDAAPGRTWSWRARSTDGATTVDARFEVARTEEVQVGPDRVPTLVVEAVLVLSGDVVSTSRQTLWVATSRRLVVRQDDVTEGRIGLVAFSATSSDTLVSLTPG